MIKIVPWADRKLSMKNWRKIWNLFPYGEICMTEINDDWEHQNWAEKIARYYVARGREFSVEINPVRHYEFVNTLLEIGVRKFYFIWKGLRRDNLFSAFDVLVITQDIIQRYPDVQIIIIYEIQYKDKPPDMDMVQTSIYTMCNMTKKYDNIELLFRYPHPWSGLKRGRRLKQIEEWIDKYKSVKEMKIEPRCGCKVITPNTCIFTCPFCPRRKRKKKFGNADRDKYVLGTIDIGLFRTLKCTMCKTSGKYGLLEHNLLEEVTHDDYIT